MSVVLTLGMPFLGIVVLNKGVVQKDYPEEVTVELTAWKEEM